MSQAVIGGPEDMFTRSDKGWCALSGCEGILEFAAMDHQLFVYRCNVCGHEIFRNTALKVDRVN
jgi:hypothetical protein